MARCHHQGRNPHLVDGIGTAIDKAGPKRRGSAGCPIDSLTLWLGREDVHFMFASMARYQFRGLLKDQEPEGHGSVGEETI